jgi:murein DD-endopeptidase MepM/ murein hydrolase activator NlpD
MRRQLLLPTLLTGCLGVVMATSGVTDAGDDGQRADATETKPISATREIQTVQRPTTTVPPTTTTTAPPPPPPTTTTTAPPPPPTTEPPPPAEPEPEVELSSGGGIVCPVAGPVDFVDSWGDSRSGGRAHKGTDMMAASGTPTVAPVGGTVEHRGSSLGGLSWYVHGDDGTTYYGTHLSGYENEGAGWVEAGTVIGYVGESGNAGSPHLHFEVQPGGGSSVNPYSLVAGAC